MTEKMMRILTEIGMVHVSFFRQLKEGAVAKCTLKDRE